jgi:hypothetical protein
MQVLVNNTYHSDLIECPDDIVHKLLHYQEEFDKFAVIHDYPVSLDTFIDWVNQKHLKNREKKITIISNGIIPTDAQKKLPHINY